MDDLEKLSNFFDLPDMDGTLFDPEDRRKLRDFSGLYGPRPGDGMKNMLEREGYNPDIGGFLKFRIDVFWPSEIYLGNISLDTADANKMANTDFVFATAFSLMTRDPRTLREKHTANIEEMLSGLRGMENQE